MWAWIVVGCVTTLAPDGTGGVPTAEVLPPSGSAEAPREDDSLFGDEVRDARLDLEPDAIARLALTADDANDAPYVPATLTVGGDSFPVTLRLKGGNGSFRPFADKPSFRIDFGDVAPVERGRWLILNNLVQDPSMLGEHLAYGAYRSVGLPASRHGFARLVVNDEPFGLYGIVEPVEHDLVARLWPEDADGLLVEGGVDAVPAKMDDLEIVQDGPLAPLVNMVTALDAATPDTYLDVLDTWFDPEQLLGVWAVELATGNPDAYLTRHNNYFLYWKASEQNWVMLPWGTDTAFSEPLGWWTPDYDGQLYLKCLDAPACRQTLRGRLTAVAEWWDTGAPEAARAAAAASTEADCVSDPRSDGGREGCEAGREALADFVEGRGAELWALLAE